MEAVSVRIHNFRSIHHLEIALKDLTLLAGANNSGKSTILEAIRMFYGETKWDDNRDKPKKDSTDADSWVEIEYRPSEAEGVSLKKEYKSETGTFRVRNYIKPSADSKGKVRSGYFSYENGSLSENQFYGEKNVGAGKLGHLVFIPAVSKVDENLKLTGPSALRELLAEVLNKAVSETPAYVSLSEAFMEFSTLLKAQESPDGRSLGLLEAEVSEELAVWKTRFYIDISNLQPEDMIKTLLTPTLVDETTGSDIEHGNFGAGFQRHLIYSLIKLAALHSRNEKTNVDKTVFSPKLTWILFEEPEAFLHPSQQEIMHENLLKLGQDANWQVLLTTHSSHFVSRSMDELTRLVRLRRDLGVTNAYQLSDSGLAEFFDTAFEIDQTIKQSSSTAEDQDKAALMAALKIELWMQSSRASSFFSDRVILVEGASEVALYSYLVTRKKMKRPRAGLTILDCQGKWNIHRFMSLLGSFGIDHSVLYDGDSKSQKNETISEAIKKSRNQFTKRITELDKDVEAELGIELSKDKYVKPQHILYCLEAGLVDEERIGTLVDEFGNLANADI